MCYDWFSVWEEMINKKKFPDVDNFCNALPARLSEEFWVWITFERKNKFGGHFLPTVYL
jgi:hypothetical protein